LKGVRRTDKRIIDTTLREDIGAKPAWASKSTIPSVYLIHHSHTIRNFAIGDLQSWSNRCYGCLSERGGCRELLFLYLCINWSRIMEYRIVLIANIKVMMVE
jgi:hypothetical protein